MKKLIFLILLTLMLLPMTAQGAHVLWSGVVPGWNNAGGYQDSATAGLQINASWGPNAYLGYLDVPFRSGFYFRNLTIPKGASIDSSKLVPVATGANDRQIRLYAAAADNPSIATFADSASFHTLTNTLTSAYVSWHATTGEAWTGERHQSPLITTVLQEKVNSSGWSSGSSIAIISMDNSGQSGNGSYQRRAFRDSEGYGVVNASCSLYVWYDDAIAVTASIVPSNKHKTTVDLIATLSGGTSPYDSVQLYLSTTKTDVANLVYSAQTHHTGVTGPTDTFSKSGLTSGVKYYFRVKAFDAGVAGDTTDIDSLVTFKHAVTCVDSTISRITMRDDYDANNTAARGPMTRLRLYVDTDATISGAILADSTLLANITNVDDTLQTANTLTTNYAYYLWFIITDGDGTDTSAVYNGHTATGILTPNPLTSVTIDSVSNDYSGEWDHMAFHYACPSQAGVGNIKVRYKAGGGYPVYNDSSSGTGTLRTIAYSSGTTVNDTFSVQLTESCTLYVAAWVHTSGASPDSSTVTRAFRVYGAGAGGGSIDYGFMVNAMINAGFMRTYTASGGADSAYIKDAIVRALQDSTRKLDGMLIAIQDSTKKLDSTLIVLENSLANINCNINLDSLIFANWMNGYFARHSLSDTSSYVYDGSILWGLRPSNWFKVGADTFTSVIPGVDLLQKYTGAICDTTVQVLYPPTGISPKDSVQIYCVTGGVYTLKSTIKFFDNNRAGVIDTLRFENK